MSKIIGILDYQFASSTCAVVKYYAILAYPRTPDETSGLFFHSIASHYRLALTWHQ